ncbi:MAG TPA: hypothetical protein VNH11_19300 [Pirellulales bacterium]|nr:hypothetical protein [Pirellulales bacterium]HVA48520.1 hypothetical protein [Pirellulales bacterium]
MATASIQKLKTFRFVVYLRGVRGITRRLQDRVYEAGCDDAALVCQNGKVLLDFDREAASMPDAIQSALTDIERAGLRASEIVLR